MTGVLVVMVMIVVSGLSLGQAQLNVDLSKATKDPATGNYCVMQKVCITNPPEGLTSAGCAPSAPPGCECDPLQPADLFCDKGETCSANNCACLREGCDCDPYAPDPDSFCPNQDEKCKDDCTCGKPLPPGCDCDPYAQDPDSMCPANSICENCRCVVPLPPGCDCDPYAENPDSSCPNGQKCKNCMCEKPLPAGCDCDPYAPNPDSTCPSGQMCKDCMCETPLPPGCNCDPMDPNPDSFCSSGQVCKNCVCDFPLPAGCNCDPRDPNPDSSCMAGQVCQDCMCEFPLAPGCDCDPNHPCPAGQMCKDDCTCGALLPDGCDCLDDSYCSGEDRCVGCKCQSCPASQPRAQVVNPPLVFVIDTTKSVKPDKDSIFNLTMKVVSNIMKDDINIPRYQLISFNDYGPDIRRNVRLELDTTDVRKFGQAAAAIKFESYNGGRDSKERLTQGLYIALQNALEKSLIVVFTDNGTKNLNLEKEILRLKAEKECEVFIVLTPEFEGRANGKSLPLYSRLGKVFLISDVGAESFLTQVEEYEENNCV